MEVQGYCYIKKDATTGRGSDEIETFLGEECRVMEFDPDGGVLVVNRQATSLATFDKEDVKASFKCKMCGDVLVPPNLNHFGQMMYFTKVMNRKGGYNTLLKNMVIQASLHKGELNDDLLFQKEREENLRHESK